MLICIYIYIAQLLISLNPNRDSYHNSSNNSSASVSVMTSPSPPKSPIKPKTSPSKTAGYNYVRKTPVKAKTNLVIDPHTEHTCRGRELLEPSSHGKCPASNFDICKEGIGYKTWTRVCSNHSTVSVDATRAVIIQLPITDINKGFEYCQQYVIDLLKPFHQILKSELLIRVDNKYIDGGVIVEGRVFCAIDRKENATLLILDLNSRYGDILKAYISNDDVSWIKCNAHKHLCLGINFTNDSKSSCIAGWVKHITIRSCKII